MTLEYRVLKGATNVSVTIRIIDSTDGTPELGVVAATTGLVLNYRRELAANVSLATITNLALLTTAHTDKGILHIGNGYYRVDVPDAAFATGVTGVLIHGLATGMVVVGAYAHLVDVNDQDAVRMGMTALPNAAADAAGGLAISDAGGLALDDIPITAEFEARTLVAASYFDPAADTVALVTDITTKTGFSLSATGLDAIASTATGMVEIAKAIWDRVLTGATHNTATSAGRRLRALQDFGVYEGGLVWVDTVNGAAGTVDFENGVTNLPSLTIADAVTIMDSIPLPGLHIVPGSTVTLAATINSKEIVGIGYTLALGGQNIDNLHTFGAISVTGVSTAATRSGFHDCVIGTASLQNARCTDCSFIGTVTMTLAGAYRFVNCQSGVAGAGTPTFAKTSLQTITAEWRRWSGSLTFSGIEAGDVATISGDTLGNIVLNGADGSIKIVGIYESITDNRTGSPVLTIVGAVKGSDVADVLVDTGTTIPTLIGTPAADLAADIAALNDLSAAQVNAEVLDVLVTDTHAEPAQGTPGATVSLKDKIGFLYKAWRNKSDQTATLYQLYNDDALTVDHKAVVSDDATTYVSGEVASGP